ncbi:uncharacterized protein [Ptychodera flava]|uniref:uncharacterized protein n=1 Tax=Ptychodera flava TaxID=63121 RepID=UPI00396A6B77
MPPSEEPLYDEDDSRRDNIACKGKLMKWSEELIAECEKMKKSSEFVKDCREQNLLVTTQELIQISESGLRTASSMCQALATAIKQITQAMSASQHTINQRKGELKFQEKWDESDDTSQNSSPEATVLAELHKMDQVLSALIAEGNQSLAAAEKITEAASAVTKIVDMSASEVGSILTDFYKQQRQDVLDKGKETLDKMEAIVEKIKVKENEIDKEISEAKDGARLVADDGVINEYLGDADKLASSIGEFSTKARLSRDELKNLVDKVKGTPQESFTFNEASDPFERVSALKKDVRDAEEKVMRDANEAMTLTEKAKSVIQEDREKKKRLFDEAEQFAEKCRLSAEDIETRMTSCASLIDELEPKVRGSNLEEEEFSPALQEINKAREILQDLSVTTRDKNSLLQAKFHDIKSMLESTSSVGDLQVAVFSVTELSKDVDASVNKWDAAFEVVQKHANELQILVEKELENDESWKLIKETDETLPRFLEDAKKSDEAALECNKMVEVIKQDMDESSKLAHDLKKMGESLSKSSKETEKVTKKLEESIRNLEKAKTEHVASEVEQELVSNVHSLTKESQNAVGKTRTTIAECKGILTVASDILEKQKALEKIRSHAKECHSAVDHANRLHKRLCKDVDAFKREVEDTTRIKSSVVDGTKGSTLTKQTSRRSSIVNMILQPEIPDRGSSRKPSTTVPGSTRGSNATQSQYENDVDRSVVPVNPEIYRQVEKMEKSSRDNTNKAKELMELAGNILQEAEDKYKRRESNEEMQNICTKSADNFQEVTKYRELVTSTSEEIKKVIAEFLAGLAAKKARQEAAWCAKKVEDAMEWLLKCVGAAEETASRASRIVDELQSFGLGDDEGKENLKSGSTRAKAKAEKARVEADSTSETLTSTRTLILDSHLSEGELREQEVKLEKLAEEILKLTSEVEAEVESCHKYNAQAQKMINSQKRTQAVERAREILQMAKEMAEECGKAGKDATDSIDTTNTAVDDCGRDTDEARKAIEHVLEVMKVFKEKTEAAVKTQKNSAKTIDQLYLMTRQEKYGADEIDEAADDVKRCTTEMKSAISKLDELSKRLHKCIGEMDNKNPKKWDCRRCYIGNDENEDQLLCVIRAPHGVLDGVEIVCSEEDHLLKGAVGMREMPFSHVVKLEPQNITLSKFALVAIPYDGSLRSRDREIVVKTTATGKNWRLMSTNSTDRTFDEYKGKAFAEVRINKFSTFVAISRMVRDHARMDRRGGTLTSSVERRVSITYPVQTFRSPTEVSIEVQMVDATTVAQLRDRICDRYGDIESCSPIVYVSYFSSPKFYKAMTVRIPLPNSTSRQEEKEKASAHGRPPSQQSRPSTSMEPGLRSRSKDSQAVDYVPHVMGRTGKEPWKEFSGNLINTAILKNDVIEFQLEKPIDMLLLIMSPTGGQMHRPKIAAALERLTKTSLVNIIFHQYEYERDRALVQLVQEDQCYQTVERLMKHGFVGPPDPSKIIELQEEQEICMKFNGNICRVDEEETKFTFYRGRPTRLEFRIKEVNQYRNFASDSHIGTVEFYAKESDIMYSNTDQAEVKETERFLDKLPIFLPKLDQGPPRPKTSCKTAVKIEGSMSEDNLRNLSQRIGPDFETIGAYLGFDQPKIQRIKRDNPNSVEDQVFDMLISWRNSERRSADKISKLCNALRRSGRIDLTEYMKEHQSRPGSHLSMSH